MKLNNKGWGTMEMLLLSCGLLIALIVAVFFISKLYGSFTGAIGNKQYIDLENKLESLAIDYIDDKNIKINGEYKVTLDMLKNSGYIDELIDINGLSCDGYVKISNNDYLYRYYGYISCNDYQTANY